MTDLERRLKIAEMVVAASAEVALGHFRARSDLVVGSKGPRDFVSEADRQTEIAAKRLLAELCPGEVLVGEEFGGHADKDYWILDPIDGTTNFLNGLPIWAVSLAYVSCGEPAVGVIALPALGECYAAATGLGIRPEPGQSGSRRASADFALAGVGRNGHWPREQRFALEQALESSGYSVVCLGSCASSIAMVASGRMSGYAERMVKPWDVAAGRVLCAEANLTAHASTNPGNVDIVVGDEIFVELVLGTTSESRARV